MPSRHAVVAMLAAISCTSILIAQMNEPTPTAGEVWFLRGDADGDHKLTLLDVVYQLEEITQPTSSLECADAYDFDDSGHLDVMDAVGLIGWLYLGHPAPSGENPICGPDLTDDEWFCDRRFSCP